MPTVTLTPVPYFTGLDANGNPINGGKLFSYVAGTTTKQDTYTTAAGSTPNANPVVLDSSGRASVFLDVTLSYKLVLAPANDSDPPLSPIWTQDNITSVPASQTVISTGLVVGFAGTVVADQIQLGDANLLWDFDSGTQPKLQFASGDTFSYNRASNFFEWDIASTLEMKLSATGLEIADGLVVGFAGTPTADRIQVADSLFYMGFDIVAGEHGMVYDSGDYDVYSRSTNTYKWYIGNTVEMSLAATGLTVTNLVTAEDALITSGLVVGFAGTPAADTIQLGDASFGISLVAGVGILTLDAGTDRIAYDRATNTYTIEIAGTSRLTIAGTVGVPQNGTVGAPSFYVGDATDTGLYRPAAQTLGITAGGVACARFVPTGEVQFMEPLVALGGGAAPTLGTIGGSGPAAAAQNTWLRIFDSTGAAAWIPIWK
jgi:hypothetical protein